MNTYNVYIKKIFAHNYGFLQEKIYGYSEDDALTRSNIKREHIESIHSCFI
jgi:hypothetical protein